MHKDRYFYVILCLIKICIKSEYILPSMTGGGVKPVN